MEQSAKSALGSARDRFVEGLTRRGEELRTAIAGLAADPDGRAVRDDVQRRLQALLANSQLFELNAIIERVEAVLERVGEPGTKPPLSDDDFDALNGLADELVRFPIDRPPGVAHSGVHKVLEANESGSSAAGSGEQPPSRSSASDLQSFLSQTDADLQVLLSQAEIERLAALSAPADSADPLLQRASPTPMKLGWITQTQTDWPAVPSHLIQSAQDSAPAEAREVQSVDQQASSEPSSTTNVEPGRAEAASEPPPSDEADPELVERLLAQVLPDLPELLDPLPDAPVVVRQTVPGLLVSPVHAKLLLVCSRPHALRLQELLDDTGLDISHAADAEDAIRQLHAENPVCVLLSAEFATLPDIDLIRRMQTDPLSRVGGTYVLLPEGASFDADYVQQTGADDVLVEPLNAQRVADLVRQSARRGRAAARSLRGLASGTVDEIANHVADEIRRGIADALRAGQHERITLGTSEELMSAAWSAIGRVRSHLAEQSRGRVSFRDDASRDVPSFMAPERRSEPSLAGALAGKRVLVADDDPAVLWFFSGMLREASAQVLQAQNGREALEIARRRQPHLVLSDILMPKVDGFALTREIKRDALLAHVPVILLSWKDDLLERMRELDAGASGYVRKEAGSREIMAAIMQVMGPRTDLVAALRAESEVLGRVESVGVLGLLETVAAERPDARVTVQDAWNLFEVELRGGQRLSVTRTAADGSFARGERALAQLIGVTAGRYSVHDSGTSLRSPLTESLQQAVQTAGKALCATLDAVSDTRLVHVALLAFEPDVVELLQNCTPTRLHEVVAHFRVSGATAKDLLFDGSFTPAELESHLRELARSGAISGVWNAQGDDLVAAARRAREDQPGTLLHSSNPPHGQRTSFTPAASAKTAALAEVAADPANAPAPWSVDEQTDPDAAVAPAAAAVADDTADDDWRIPRVGGKALAEGTRLVLTLAALVAIGYLGWQRLEPHTRLAAATPRDEAAEHRSAQPAAAPTEKAPEPTAAANPTPLETAVRSGTDPDLSLGRILPYVDETRGVAVGPEQGLLVLEYTGGAPAPEIRISGRDMGRPPIAVALDVGRHELVVQQNRDSSFRYLIVRAGETRVITLPF